MEFESDTAHDGTDKWESNTGTMAAAILAPRGLAGRSYRYRVGARKAFGTLLTLNFALLWAAPVLVQGQMFRHGLHRLLRPLFGLLDNSSTLRNYAKHVYRRPVHADYFATAILFTVGYAGLLGTVFAYQIATGSLPLWLIAVYYFLWVGPGGRSMAAAYTFAHREGHLPGGRMYHPWIGDRIGNFFENWVGVWYGIVPYTFSTSHLLLHHRLDGGKGDPVYVWDLDRTKFGDLMLYQWRFFLYLTGISSMAEFRRQRGILPAIERARKTLGRGMIVYWLGLPTAIVALLVALGSSLPSALLFLFLVYFQPLLAMSFFLSLINFGWHAFLEFDEAGRHMKHVTSTTILDGHDDSFGEDYHLAHHHFGGVGHDELPDHALAQRSEWARCHGAIFEKTTIFELAIMTHLGQFDSLIRKHYVDFAGGIPPERLAELFERRAKRTEMSYLEYEFHYVPHLREKVRELVRRGVCENEDRAYVYQAHRNLQSDLSIAA